ncbi:ribosomal protein S5 domain 2-like protein [Coprinopsis marcescibilis]|uniref:Ribosomal RNA-processing protein 43 n=1 Tax=Coprinopsis marcescibilis TaxID=230819 RepID=A0A5C3L8E9_COPMA|nr:ribosomal protein S5 domain 2-like protein [Coprinopsis marcescibilis]
MTSPQTLSQEDQEGLKASVFQRLHPRAYLERFVAEGYRPDGRSFSSWRDVSVNVGSISTANGSALVRIGNTTVVCGVKAEVAEPELDCDTKGFLVPNLDLPALCSPRFKPGPPSDEAQVLSARLNEAIVASGVLPLESLCIHPRKSVWTLYVDAICINYDGNAFDAALLAMILALKNTRLPKAQYDEQTGRTLCSRTETDGLSIQRIPFAVSFGIFDSSHILADPSSFEEPLLDGTLTVILDEHADILSASQIGVGSSTQDALSTCISQAKQHHAAVFKSIYT